MTTILIVIHIAVSLFLVGIVLLQQGKGASAGATLGGGGSQTMFGSEGPMPLMNKITTGAAIIFMATSISLAYISAHKSGSSVMENTETRQESGLNLERGPETVPEKSDESPVSTTTGTAGQNSGEEETETLAFPLDNSKDQGNQAR
ncbi:MAG: preprotein translocase subunit SecG [Thermodesulfobacteriota bacterium]